MSFMNEMKKKVAVRSRESKLSHFYSLCKEGMTVLDVGVSNETKRVEPETTNYFLKSFRYDAKFYTGLSIEDIDGMDKLFPGKRIVQYPGGVMPFQDKEFDWVFSNAVIEHVGDYASQLQFLNELLRVAHNVFFTTPSKYFPVESHSNLFFLHWNSALFYRYCASKNVWWTSIERLNLLSGYRLRQLVEQSNSDSYEITSNRVLLMPMTYTVVCSQGKTG
ncbi:MAG: methyltransferase domain-containing protein [Nitrospira sp.]|nr:methyltransferase domain-containing protein [bacterium]MBL7050214.1 methyltransferase domain-containing protein [Nitrospira sp.]